MARQKGVANHFQPTKGFVTEFTDTRFPADAAIDCDNGIFDRDGSFRRRPGLNFETGFELNNVAGQELTATERDEFALSTGLWKAVSNSGTLNIVVQQVGLVLQFYAQLGAVSSQLLGELDISPYGIDLNLLASNNVSVTSGMGRLYVAAKYMDPIVVEYDGTDFTAEKLTPQVRDLDGVDDGLEVDERPELLTIEHYYNLRNQGWTEENMNIFAGRDSDAGFGGFPLAADSGKDWPSNADIMYLGFTVDNDGDPVFERQELVEAHYVGNTPAPKGHFLLDPFFRDRASAIDLPGQLPVTVFPTRPEHVTFHNGKVFFSQPNLQGEPAGIYYSQTLTQPDKASNWHTEADPTAEEINDVVATDGGFVTAPAIGEIIVLKELASGVFVGASNGAWFMTGANIDEGFSATSNRLIKLDQSGLLSAESYVEAENVGFYFGIEGIHIVAPGDTGQPVVQNLSQDLIQSFYINISAVARRQARGVYVPEQRKVYWVYQDADARNDPDAPYTKVLVYDLSINGFYPYSIGSDQENSFPEVVGVTLVPPIGDNVVDEPVTTNDGEPIYLLDGVTPVTIERTAQSSQVTSLKLVTMVWSGSGWQLTFSEFNDRTFHDWRTWAPDAVGINFLTFCEFGYNTFGTQHTKGQPVYVHSFFAKDSKNLKPGGYYELPPIVSNECILITCSLTYGATDNIDSNDGQFSIPLGMTGNGKIALTANEDFSEGGKNMYYWIPDENCEWSAALAANLTYGDDSGSVIRKLFISDDTRFLTGFVDLTFINGDPGDGSSYYYNGWFTVYEEVDCVWTPRASVGYPLDPAANWYQPNGANEAVFLGTGTPSVSQDASTVVGNSPVYRQSDGGGGVLVGPRGRIDIFEWNSITEEYEYAFHDEAAQSRYHRSGLGYSTDISDNGNIVVAGEGGYDTDGGSGVGSAGSVAIYVKDNGVWSEVQEITVAADSPVSAARPAAFGNQVSLSADGTVLAISDPSATVSGETYAGKIYIYTNPSAPSGSWTLDSTLEVQPDLLGGAGGQPLYLGSVLRLSADGTTLIAQVQDPADSNSQRKQVEVYRNSGGWAWLERFTATNGSETLNSLLYGDEMELSADGNKALISAYWSNKIDVRVRE